MTRMTPAAAACKFAPAPASRGREWWEGEAVLTLREAMDAAPGDPKPTYLTVWGWCKRGIKGWKLQSISRGGRLLTTREAMARFFRAIGTGPAPGAELDATAPPPPGGHDPQALASTPPRTFGERVERMNSGLADIFAEDKGISPQSRRGRRGRQKPGEVGSRQKAPNQGERTQR